MTTLFITFCFSLLIRVSSVFIRGDFPSVAKENCHGRTRKRLFIRVIRVISG